MNYIVFDLEWNQCPDGKEKEIKFKTSRELREDAYLELEVMQIRGVVNWREVQQDELPEDVKTAMNIE